MQTARMTVLMTPERKAEIEARALQLGVSSGEFLRLAAERFDVEDAEEGLAALTAELREAVPQMAEDLAAMRNSIAEARAAIDASLRATGARS